MQKEKYANTLPFPMFLDKRLLPSGYYEAPNPYKNSPNCNVNLLELLRFAKKNGKKLIELTKEEVEQFRNK